MKPESSKSVVANMGKASKLFVTAMFWKKEYEIDLHEKGTGIKVSWQDYLLENKAEEMTC